MSWRPGRAAPSCSHTLWPPPTTPMSQPAAVAAGSLLNWATEYLSRRAELHTARVAGERAVAIFEAAYGSDHAEVARPLGNLGIVLRQLGKLEAARAALERALAIF